MLPLSGMKVYVVYYITENSDERDFLAVFSTQSAATEYMHNLLSKYQLDPEKLIYYPRWVDNDYYI